MPVTLSLASPRFLILCATLAACSSVVVVPETTGSSVSGSTGSGGATSASVSASGTGGATSASTTGSGGSCTGACMSCVSPVPWSATFGVAGMTETLPGPGRLAGADGSVILLTFEDAVMGNTLTGVPPHQARSRGPRRLDA